MQNQGPQQTNTPSSMGDSPANLDGPTAIGGDASPATKIAAKIEGAKSVLVALSKDPSADEISAALGLAMLLDSMGKHVTAIYSGKTPNALRFLKPEKTFETNANSLQDFIIALNKDKADHLRYKVDGDFVKIYITPYKTKISEEDLEFSHGDFNVDLIIAVDVKDDNDLDAALVEHGRIMHDAGTVNISIEKPGRFAEVSWCETDASSVCEMVTRMTDHLKVTLTPEVATALLTGIVANTNRFMNEKTTPKAMTVASKLMTAGANQVLISQNVMEEGKTEKTSAEKEIAAKMEEELEKPLTSKKAEKSEEAKELDELAALAVSAAEESAEKMPGKVPDTEPRLEIKDEEEDDNSKKLLDEKSFEKEMNVRREMATKIGEGIPDAPTKHEVPGSENVNTETEEKKEDERLLKRDSEDEKKSDEEALEEALEHIGESGGKSVDVMGELKEMAGEDDKAAEKEEGEKGEEEKGEEGGEEKKEEKPLMGAIKLDENDSPKDRPDTTGARNVRDLEKMKSGVVLTEEMTAGDVLGDESAAASEKVLAAEIYPDIHKIPEDVKEVKPRSVDYGSMMEEALTERTQSLADSPIAAAPVGQGAPSLQEVAQGLTQGGMQKRENTGAQGESGLNPAAQMAPQVMNQPEANHIPTMEYIPDGSMQDETPAQMNGDGGYLATPPATPQQMAMQVMDQMGNETVGVSLPVAPAPPVDITQMMPPQDGQGLLQQGEPQIGQGPELAGGIAGDAGKDGMTAGQLYQKNDPSAFHIPGM